MVLVRAAVLLMIGVSLAGCSADGPAPLDGVDALVQEPTLAVLRVLLNGTLMDPLPEVVEVGTGMNVTFDGSASTGTGGVYLWDFGDGGRATTPNATHAFTQGGLHNVTLTVGAGDNESVASAVFDVTTPAPAVPTVVETAPFEFTGTLPLGNPNAPTSPGTDYSDHVVTIRGATEDGRPVVAREVRIVLDGSGETAVDAFLYWRSPDGENLAQAGSIGGARLDQEVTYTGEMAPGDYVVRVRLSTGAGMEYTVTGEADYYDS